MLLAHLRLHVSHRDRSGVLPLEVVLSIGADRSDECLVKARRDDELIGVEQPLVTLIFLDLASGPALIRVPTELVDRGEDGLSGTRALALDDDHRDAVDEQNDVRDDEAFGEAARAIDPEL